MAWSGIRVRRALTALIAALSLVCVSAKGAPWRARKRPDIPLPNKLADARVAIAEWEPEPTEPKTVDPERFARALAKLCAFPSSKRAEVIAQAAIDAGKQFDIDPFLLGALGFTGTYCRARYQDALGV